MESFIEVRKGKLYCKAEGRGEAMIFLHADSLDHRMWHKQISHFKTKYLTIAYDLRGYGKSAIPDSPYSHTEDLFELMYRLKIRKSHLVGSSLGGAEILKFALKYPDNVLSQTLIDPRLSGYKFSSEFKQFANSVFEKFKLGDIEQAKEIWLNGKIFKEPLRHANIKKLLKEMINDYSGFRWSGDKYRIRATNIISGLSQIQIPTLILCGKEDLEDFKNISKLIYSRIRNSRFYNINYAGHLPNLEKPAEVNNLIDDFLNKL